MRGQLDINIRNFLDSRVEFALFNPVDRLDDVDFVLLLLPFRNDCRGRRVVFLVAEQHMVQERAV